MGEKGIPSRRVQGKLRRVCGTGNGKCRRTITVAKTLCDLLSIFVRCRRKRSRRESTGLLCMRGTRGCVRAGCSCPIAIRSVTSCMKVDEDRLFHSFRACVGYSPGRCLARCEVRRTYHLLGRAKLSISTVTCSINFRGGLCFSGTFQGIGGADPARCERGREGGGR